MCVGTYVCIFRPGVGAIRASGAPDAQCWNSPFKEGKYAEAMQKYRQALKINDNSDVAKFNLGLSQIRMADRSGGQQKDDSISRKLLSEGVELMTQVARIGAKKADLSSKANYNLGNLRFEQEDYAGAIQMYKQALRLNPGFENARRNLRIAQLKLQNQQDNKDDQQKQDQQKQDQQKQDQQQDKQDQNKDQQDKEQDNKPDQQQNKPEQQPAENEMSVQAAQQTLNPGRNRQCAIGRRPLSVDRLYGMQLSRESIADLKT